MTARAALTAGTVLSLAVTACAAACGSPSPLPPGAVALAYMSAHPVPFAPGMTAGIVLTSDDVGFIVAAAAEARCPATLTAYSAGAAGGLPACLAWSATVETASGRTVTVSCGSITARRACPPALTDSSAYIPNNGDYVIFRSGGTVTAAGDITLITIFAVDVPLNDTGGPVWVTTPATGGA